MRRKKTTSYDAYEKRILQQASALSHFLTMRGAIEDFSIDDAKIRKARQVAAKKAYHNTEVLLDLYRTIVWAMECIPGELATELKTPMNSVDELVSKLDIEIARENKKLESRLNGIVKTRVMIERLQEALMVLRKKPNDGEQLYNIIYDAYLDPVERDVYALFERAQVAPRTYYRMRSEAITVISIKLWSAPSGDIDDWLEILTMLQDL